MFHKKGQFVRKVATRKKQPRLIWHLGLCCKKIKTRATLNNSKCLTTRTFVDWNPDGCPLLPNAYIWITQLVFKCVSGRDQLFLKQIQFPESNNYRKGRDVFVLYFLNYERHSLSSGKITFLEKLFVFSITYCLGQGNPSFKIKKKWTQMWAILHYLGLGTGQESSFLLSASSGR